MSQYCPALPAPTCPTTPAYNQCHQVSTYDHSSYQNYCCTPTPQYTTPQLDQCSSHNQTGKFKQLLGDFEQIKVCGQADILCDLDVGGVLNVTTIQSNTGTVNINDNLAVLGTLDVCNIECPGGTLTLHGTVSIPTLATSNLDASILMNVVNFSTTVNVLGTLNACSISCNDGGAVNFGTVTNFSTNVVVQGTLYACSISCNDGGAISFGTVANFSSTTNFATTVNVLGTLNACSISCPNGTVSFGTVTNFATTVNIAGTLNACSISCPNGTVNFGSTVNFATTVNIAGTLNVCSISCPNGTLNIASTLAVNTLFSNNVTICVGSIVTDVINQTFTSTQAAMFNGTLVLPEVQGPCGNTVPVLPLTSANATIKYATITDGTGGSALNIESHANFASYASPNPFLVAPGVPINDPNPPNAFLGYQTPTSVPLTTPLFATTPAFTSIAPDGCITVNVQGIYQVQFQSVINVANNILNTPFLNIRFILSDSTGNVVNQGIETSYTFGDGTVAGAATFWSNQLAQISGYNSANSQIFTALSNFNIGIPAGATLCFYLDNRNSTPIVSNDYLSLFRIS